MAKDQAEPETEKPETTGAAVADLASAIQMGVDLGKVVSDDSKFSHVLRSSVRYQNAGKMRELATYGAIVLMTLAAVGLGAFVGG